MNDNVQANDNEQLLRGDESNNSFNRLHNTLLEAYHSDLVAIILSSLLAVIFFVLVSSFLKVSGICEESLFALISSTIASVLITSVYYVANYPVLV